MEAFFGQLGKMLRYPRIARSDRLQGLVLVSFSIDEDGKMADFESLTSRQGVLYREVVRVLSDVKGAWSTAYQDKKMTLPVLFVIGKSKPAGKANVEDPLPGSRVLSEVVVVAYQERRVH